MALVDVPAPRIGCDHEPLTQYCERLNVVVCSACAEAYTDERFTYLSTFGFEADAVAAELEEKRQACLRTMRTCPSMLQLEAVRTDLKRDIDAVLLSVIRSVDEAMKRLHSEVDTFVDERITASEQLNDTLQQLDSLKTKTTMLRRSDSAAVDAVTCHALLSRNRPLFDRVGPTVAAVDRPFQLRLKRDLCRVDLSTLRVVAVDACVDRHGADVINKEREAPRPSSPGSVAAESTGTGSRFGT